MSEIESTIESMSNPMKKLTSLGLSDPRSSPDEWFLQGLSDKFVTPYLESIGELLEILLVRISNTIESQKDAWILYKKIIELKIK